MTKQLSRGTKRICQSTVCALPFYDLNQTNIWCPNCGALFDESVMLHPRREQVAATSGKGARGAHAFAARQSEVKSLPSKLDEEEESETTTSKAIDADADTLPLEEEVDDEIADVVISPEDDQAER